MEQCINSSIKTCKTVIDDNSTIGVIASHCECVLTSLGKRVTIMQKTVKFIIVLYVIFHLWMLFDCIFRKEDYTKYNKPIWVLLLIFIPISSPFYFFKVYRKD